jgi:phytoene dehydrogenase-like protein
LEKPTDTGVIIIGAGLAGLSCAGRLQQDKVPFIILEADQRIGGRLKTDRLDGFLLDHGFQVLQTAYPEARRALDFRLLELKRFAPGAIIRVRDEFHRIADPRRRPREFWQTLRAPIGTIGDKMRIAKLMRRLVRTDVPDLFQLPDLPAIDFLKNEGFSDKIIRRFFQPFFGGVCLDPDITASSRVFSYVFRLFAEGDVALPSQGMKAIPEQLAEPLPPGSIRLNADVESITDDGVMLASGIEIQGDAVVIAAEGPEVSRLLGKPSSGFSRGEWCIYFGTDHPPLDEPYLILNGGRQGWVNSLTVPSTVAPSYAPAGRSLISVVVIGHQTEAPGTVEEVVRRELSAWFGASVETWQHIETYQIPHALPDQRPPMPDPTAGPVHRYSNVYVCGEYDSVPGIQWALLSGRRTAEKILADRREAPGGSLHVNIRAS